MNCSELELYGGDPFFFLFYCAKGKRVTLTCDFGRKLCIVILIHINYSVFRIERPSYFFKSNVQPISY